jgi:hypothetical protein
MIDWAVIISSALFGGYAFVRGLTMFSKSGSFYPNEYLIILAARAGQANHFPWQIYGCWVIMLMLALGSLIYHSTQRALNVDKYSYGRRMKDYQERTKQRQDAYLGQQKNEGPEGVAKGLKTKN